MVRALRERVANDAQLKPIVDAFQAKYPALKVEYVSLNATQVFQRYLSEKATGARTADVILSSGGTNWLDLLQRREVAQYTEPNAAQLPPYATLAPGVYAMSEDPVIAVFNKKLLPEAQQPTTLAGLADLASGALKGKIATYAIDDAFGFDANAGYLAKNGEAGWAVLDKLGKGTKGEQGAATILTKLSQGQYVTSYFLSGAARVAVAGQAAQVLNFRYLTDGTPFVPRGVGVTVGATSPNAAKVFVNYVLSVEGQDAACKGGFTPYRQGVSCPTSVGALTATFGPGNVITQKYDPALLTSQAPTVRRWNAAFGRG